MPRMDGYELARAIRGHERQTGLDAHADRRADGERDAGRARQVRGRRDGRLRGQADDDPGARREAAAVAPRARLAGARAASGRPRASNGRGLDEAVLDELTGGDPALTASLLADFVETSRGDLRALADAVDGARSRAARRQAHRIMGASRIVGATELAALASGSRAPPRRNPAIGRTSARSSTGSTPSWRSSRRRFPRSAADQRLCAGLS